jgi:hypothetical protein
MLRRHLILLAPLLVTINCQFASALIVGGSGNEEVHDPGWPDGAAKIFNHPARVAWWEGPPFGGGRSTAEFRGDAATLNALLAEFAKVDARSKRVVLHDGVGASFWLNLNDEPEKRAAARIDWSFTVWEPDRWKRQQSLPADIQPTDLGDLESGPPLRLDVYTGGELHWNDVEVPADVEMVDERLQAHGFSAEDGMVLEGVVADAETERPLVGSVRLETVAPRIKGSDAYVAVRKATSDVAGHWTLKQLQPGQYRVVVAADGYVPRIVGYARVGDQLGWREFNSELSRPAPVSGQVVDAAGMPLPDISVRLAPVASKNGSRYDTPDRHQTETDAEGRFRFDMVPIGTTRIRVHGPGLVRPGLGKEIETPAKDVSLSMSLSATLSVDVVFGEIDRPSAYLIDVEPEGGNRVGSWGGAAAIDAQSNALFRNVPPDRYVLRGHPNPTSDDEITEPVTVDLAAGDVKSIELQAR